MVYLIPTYISYVSSNGITLVNNDAEGMWKEMALVYFTIYQNLSEVTEDNH